MERLPKSKVKESILGARFPTTTEVLCEVVAPKESVTWRVQDTSSVGATIVASITSVRPLPMTNPDVTLDQV